MAGAAVNARSWRRRQRRQSLIWGGVPGAIAVLFAVFCLVAALPVVVALVVYWLSFR